MPKQKVYQEEPRKGWDKTLEAHFKPDDTPVYVRFTGECPCAGRRVAHQYQGGQR